MCPQSSHLLSSSEQWWWLVTKSCLTLAIPWTIACQAPLSVGFSRQEYWSGLPFPSPGELPNPGIKPRSPALQADSLPTELQGKPHRKLQFSSVAQSCPTLCDPMDCSLPSTSDHGIFQIKILEWVLVPFSRESSYPRDRKSTRLNSSH